MDTVATEAGIPAELLREVIDGRAPITADLALALEASLEASATFWMNLQSAYELTLARQRKLGAQRVPP